ncbi:MAG TPA: glycosyltransferase family 39 protein [Prolixibacteraceae bacterium]
MSKKSFLILTICFVIIKLLIHFLTSTNYELHRDEMLYFSMGSHLSWGFASTPPMMAFFSFIIKNLFGYHEFFVKLFPALAGASIIVLIALFVRELGGKSFAVFTACLAGIISTSLLRSSSLFMPVIFELFFWTLFLFFLLKLINRQDPKYWICIGISFGLAFLNKYSILFLGLSTLIAILLSNHRKLLLSKYLVYAAVAALFIMLPNIIWQIIHKFPVATHMGELYRTQLNLVSKHTFLGEQIMMNFTAILIWLTGLFVLLFAKAERKFRLFAWLFLLVILLFLVTKGKPYYTLGVYPVMFAFGGYFLEKYLPGKLRIISWFIVGYSFLTSLFFLPLGLPVLHQKEMAAYCSFFSQHISPAPMRNEQNGYYPIPQDYMDMTGWEELASMASIAYNSLDSLSKKDCIIYANNYGQAGAMDFYGKKYHLPAPVCVNDSYIFWAPDSLVANNFIVSDNSLGDIPRLFKNYHEVGEIKNSYFRENGLKVYLCQNPTPLLNKFFRKRIRANKEIYGY